MILFLKIEYGLNLDVYECIITPIFGILRDKVIVLIVAIAIVDALGCSSIDVIT
jgi:hypothetical protein